MSDLRSLTLVVANQRSGSTLLCQDIASLGGLGVPKEWFMRLFKKGGPNVTEADLLERLVKGTVEGEPHVTGVKVMVNYASKLDAIIRQADPVDPAQALQNIVEWANDRFDNVNLVCNTRENLFEQAISVSLWNLTGVWTRKEGESDPHTANDLTPERVNLKILEKMPKVINEIRILREFVEHNKDQCMAITYEDLSENQEACAKRLYDHAVANGFKPLNTVSTRSSKKIINKDRTEKIKGDFRSFLDNDLRV